jgi:hypothetical protein
MKVRQSDIAQVDRAGDVYAFTGHGRGLRHIDHMRGVRVQFRRIIVLAHGEFHCGEIVEVELGAGIEARPRQKRHAIAQQRMILPNTLDAFEFLD